MSGELSQFIFILHPYNIINTLVDVWLSYALILKLNI